MRGGSKSPKSQKKKERKKLHRCEFWISDFGFRINSFLNIIEY